MPLALTTRHYPQTLSVKWSTQQHLAQQRQHNDETATITNLLRQPQHRLPVHKQKSFNETFHLNKTLFTGQSGRAYLFRGLSVGRSQDIQRSSVSKEVLKRHPSIAADKCNGRNARETFKTDHLIKRNVTGSEQRSSGGAFLRNSRGVQAWSSTSSILKSLDRELAHLNGVAGKCKDVKMFKGYSSALDHVKVNKSKADSALQTGAKAQSSHSNRKPIEGEVNKVNLSIILSPALDSTKEENDCVSSDRELDDSSRYDEETSCEGGKNVSTDRKTKCNKRTENTLNFLKTSASSRPVATAQQRRALYQTSSIATNSNSIASKSSLQNVQNLVTSASLTVQKRSPLIRAMSAPVRSFDERAKGSTLFLNSKRKSRRRKLNTADISCDKESCDLLSAKNSNIDSKSKINRKVLARSKSVATDVVTLVSLISSEGSDSEKEDSCSVQNNSYTGSPNKRAPNLRKTGKSVSFQENYSPTFQFASKEYSHMLRRGSIAPLSQRIKSNRPPTAPASSICHISQALCNEMSVSNTGSGEEKQTNSGDTTNTTNDTLSAAMNEKPAEEEYKFPEYVRSLKERECWKLFIKMSTKGVNISYDTILRGMLTPTEFRQLQKQREIEETKAMKEAADSGLSEQTTKRSPSGIDRLKENLLKN